MSLERKMVTWYHPQDPGEEWYILGEADGRGRRSFD